MESGKGSNRRSTLLLALVLTTTVGVMAFFGSRGGSTSAGKAGPAVPAEVVVEPLLPSGTIRSASWEGKKGPPAPAGDENSILGQHETDREVRYRESLAKAVKPVQGLGVYVAPLNPKEEVR